jgi:hypothetical protein
MYEYLPRNWVNRKVTFGPDGINKQVRLGFEKQFKLRPFTGMPQYF